MDILYRYKEIFSLRDELGTCPGIEVEIDIVDNTPLAIRPHHAKEEDKQILDKKMKRLCHLGILKYGISTYSSQVILIRRKFTKEKRCVSDFRHKY